MKTTRKVVVIGLDGVSLDILEVLAQRSAIPNINTFVHKAKYYKLLSTIPPTTAPAWTSITSGVNPGMHGIFYFIQWFPNERVFRRVRSYDILVPRIHEIISINGLRSLIVNMPYSLPPILTKNTTIVRDWLSPYPKKYVGSIEFKKILDYYPSSSIGPFIHLVNDLRMYLDLLTSEVDAKMRVLETLIEKYSWDFIFIMFSEPDWIQHRLLNVLYSGKSKFLGKVLKIYSMIDKFVGFLKNQLDEHDMLMIVSDHGQAIYNGEFRLYCHLLEELHFQTNIIEKLLCRNPCAFIIDVLRMLKLNKVLKIRGKLDIVNDEGVIQRGRLAIIPYGIYMFNTSKNLITYLKTRLETEEVKPLLRIWLREEIYKGPRHTLERFPHIVYVPNDVRKVWVYSYKLGLKLWRFSRIADHSLYGILIIYGDKLMEEQMTIETPTCTTFDVLPTILAYMNIPLPPYVDGKKLIHTREKIRYRDYRSLWLSLKRIKRGLVQGKKL